QVPQSPITRDTARRQDHILQASARNRREGRADAFREIGCILGLARSFVDPRAPAQFTKRQRRVDPARAVEIGVDETVEYVADRDTSDPAGGVRVTYDVDRTAVGQQVIELGPLGQLVDPLKIDEE